MLTYFALFFSLIYAVLKPFSDGLLDTSLWVGKILTEQFEDSSEEILKLQKKKMKSIQLGLLDGWPSFFVAMPIYLTVLALGLGFWANWKIGLIVFGVLVVDFIIIKPLLSKPIDFFLEIILKRMTNRYANYIKKNDLVRADVTKELCDNLEELLALYFNKKIFPPDTQKIKEVPYGDKLYLLLNK